MFNINRLESIFSLFIFCIVGRTFMVNINISAGDDYPSGWRKANYSGGVFCRVDVDDDVQVCSSASSSTNGRSY